MEEYTGQVEDLLDSFSQKSNKDNVLKDVETIQTTTQHNEGLNIPTQNSEQSDSIALPIGNQVEAEKMSVETEMDKMMCDSLTNELDKNTNVEEKMTEDLQNILESDEPFPSINKTNIPELVNKVAEVTSDQSEPMEVVEEVPPERNLSDKTIEVESQIEKNIEPSTEPIQSTEVKQIENNETNTSSQKELTLSSTVETEHVDMVGVEQDSEKNVDKDTNIDSNKSVIESNPLGSGSENMTDKNIDVEIEQSEKSNIEKDSNTKSISVATSDEISTNSNKEDESNKSIVDKGSLSSNVNNLDSTQSENQEGADAELCIIPDTHREISQAEKEAASSIPPLRDLAETSTTENENASDSTSTEQSAEVRIRVFKWDKDDLQLCQQCKLNRKVNYYYKATEQENNYICDDSCLNRFKENHNDKVIMSWDEVNLRVKNFTAPDSNKGQTTMSFVRKCASCKKNIENTETNLTWEIMDFCNEVCLTKYQKEIGSHCATCKGEVNSNSLGKYCVRFGNDIRQFCTSACLEKYKKGLKVCSYCQQDMSNGIDGFLAPVGDKGQFKDFCSQLCMDKYDIMTNDKPPNVPPGTICSVCKADKPITIEYEIDGKLNYCCREPCFVAFSFVNNISSGKCAMCRRHFPKSLLEQHTMYYDNAQYSFCSNSCENIYIIAHRKIVPCSWCKVKKYNFDMIRRYSKEGTVINMCSINCLNLYRVSINAVSSVQIPCNFCQKMCQPMYHLTMSDASVRNFCSYNCVITFQAQFAKQPLTINNLQVPVPTGAPRKNKKFQNATDNGLPLNEVSHLPIISSVQSLATNGNIGPQKSVAQTMNTRSTRSKAATAVTSLLNSNQQIVNSFADLPIQVQIKQHFIVRPAPLPEQRNVGTMCYTKKISKSVTAKPEMVDQAVQTDEKEASKVIIPIPMPIYVPSPMHMYSHPTPVPVPIPIPVPVPVFIPTTSNCSAGIMKQIKKLQVIPSDPYEAEILMMAEMVAEEKKEDSTDSESDVDDTAGADDSYSPEPVDTNNTFGDDMLQMALKMASELDEPAVDLEGALTANTITAPQGGESQEENVDDPQPMHSMIADRSPSVRGRKRGMRQPRGGAKRGRRMSHHQVEMPIMQHQIQQPPPPPEPIEKPDANMCLKFTFGVNAWKQWVTTKNAELEKSRRVQLFKTEILQLTSDELNYSLCLFVKEVRKPNGAEYAPDTIYYLCLGIQQYLFENGRIDNIFCDPYYEKFTDCLDEVAKKFSVLYNDSHYIVTRVEEEHLWESKQLGAHSPHVLLSTLMFFNTKHFNLTTVDEHMQLSFSHIMKHWKRNPNQPGAAKVPGSRNVLLRFYPPQSAIQNNTRKKKVYEQQENEENPLRCPVKLYEFYLSKCPESVKTRNDVFYLQPERSCIPDSPVWYSTMPLPKEALEKMLHRVKMVKEINVALLTS